MHAGNSGSESQGGHQQACGEIGTEGSPSPRQTEEAADIFGICRGDPPEGQMGKGVV